MHWTEVGEDMHTLPPEMQENEYISYAAELCEAGAYSPEQLAAYDGYWDAIRIERGLKAEGRAEGRVEGLVEGEAIGLEKGEAIGLEKGEAIGLEKGEAKGLAKGQENGVLNGHSAGYPIDVISTITGLTTEQVIEILKRHGIE